MQQVEKIHESKGIVQKFIKTTIYEPHLGQEIKYCQPKKFAFCPPNYYLPLTSQEGTT